ncbi:heavy metal-(Cd/Co/Hg/Pb/Zn)-translocating P-type ATPase [Saccharopolyspora antimicrobica]|uniref:Heavy metal-(Cd/Co/Hg/Pb/Zn)-translocating P-type ATPase n=1 Tax=Saccharopolyspora antimicrobica TaxID=455193 RepID=A0A1I4VH79_9PSEU|nr:heavy metal translocating P-type ATPase [Saccharopolyspora antimicrobica]RKT86306.1 heavy metal-(Cd/Co/Hg/Pb/Zn)-translocating P-type ATPase [Saccharopolyspora antimicrobica]SFN00551.1 heavy metal-(Cd/Co/Hg/Pb/Zn)-translocating P-type ATPase [Saccharopolyspora antimicrobica]
MTAVTDRTPIRTEPAPSRRGLLSLPEARWATASLVAFLLGLAVQLLGGPTWLFWGLYLVCYATGGWEPAYAGLQALREKTLDVDLLMIVAALGAAAIGQITDGALLIVIFATSGALEAFATARTEDSVRSLLDLAPETAVRLRDGAEETVPTAELQVGDVIVVRPGERIGADGEVVDGSSDVDQATITGEPLPVAKQLGDEVFAGTLNGTGALHVRVARDASESVIARIVALVAEASETKAPTQLFIEKVEQRYSVGVVLATLAVFGIPLLLGDDLESALLRAMTFMIVASPCAVVLATMPPLLSAIANAGRHGVLVKSAVVMERLGQTERVALDKTGTLTEGAPRVMSVEPAAGHAADEVLALAAGAEHLSEHPLARAIVAAAHEKNLTIPAAEDFQSTPGHGVSATVGGREVAVTSPRGTAAAEPDTGHTAVVVTVDGEVAGVIGIADRLRPDAAAAVSALRELTSAEPVLLTGDNERTAAKVAAEVGIADVRAGLLPADKVTAVRESAQPTMVIGDGVNDAPALAAAHCGVAMGRAGSDLALQTADVVVVRDELAAVPKVVGLSRRARRLVQQNLVIAGTFITVLVVWDLVGHLPLPLGVAGHEGSTIIVGLNGLRLLSERAWRRS